MTNITADRLREVLRYDPETGVFTWLGSGRGRRASGIAGTICNGYLHIWVDGRSYKAHRFAWLYQTGEWPEVDLDHINMDKADNRWCNLRQATDSKNQANTRARITSASWFKGVTWCKAESSWRARIGANGKQYFLGYFNKPHLAYIAYCAAAREHFGEFARVYEADQLIIPRKVFEERVLGNLLAATQPELMEAA